MKNILSDKGEALISIEKSENYSLGTPIQLSQYSIILVHKGEGIYHADFASFNFSGPTLLFSTPLQTIFIDPSKNIDYTVILFHGDFYCIEAHREEVACNGLLFNNIYLQPSVIISQQQHNVFCKLLQHLEEELSDPDSSEMILKSYLQVILAKCSTAKIRTMDKDAVVLAKDEKMEQFRILLDEKYLVLHKPNDYAAILSISPNTLTKKSIKYFGKTPSQLIQDRLILEAKKMLHLTTLSIKEIAYQLQFNDEYYFSRFFKKCTQISPQAFRNKGGISQVAYLSK
ncbi:AraC-like DNA-binding protein [Flavobacterium sp. HSC-32F16]|uniref:helix-turn-helix domain-containing protein n=1 Tax=Flavobacterium sp. HSC-32F16 TaxID=2910964 RepID=UPI0020A241E8|nr:AraC family transcriptional regulator [Flavobacterium sp. HSC-32F16]MCP2025279.1 AraC-like DNA-binding protein [Flavobacterium sp. HSC-32F16]